MLEPQYKMDNGELTLEETVAILTADADTVTKQLNTREHDRTTAKLDGILEKKQTAFVEAYGEYQKAVSALHGARFDVRGVELALDMHTHPEKYDRVTVDRAVSRVIEKG